MRYMFVVDDNKPEMDEDLLIHFGIKGMKWGKRAGKSVTGVSRHRGALLDRNDRMKTRIKGAASGDKANSTVGGRAAVKIARTIIGKERYKKNMKKRIAQLNAQDARLKAGKLKMTDRIDLTLNVSALELVVSNRSK